MKALKIYLVAVIAIVMAACKGGGDGIPLTLGTPNIDGPLGEYFRVVDKEYQIDEDGKITIEIKRFAKGMPSPWKKGMKIGTLEGECAPQFSLFVMKQGDDDYGGNIATDLVENKSEFEKMINLGENESTTITFVFPIKKLDASNIKALKKFKIKFKVASIFKCRISSKEIDALLDSYESYVNKYISSLEKVSSSHDESAMDECDKLLTKIEEYDKKLSDVTSDMSSQQSSRQMDIFNKFAEAGPGL